MQLAAVFRQPDFNRPSTRGLCCAQVKILFTRPAPLSIATVIPARQAERSI
jgi:hypothetical protein